MKLNWKSWNLKKYLKDIVSVDADQDGVIKRKLGEGSKVLKISKESMRGVRKKLQEKNMEGKSNINTREERGIYRERIECSKRSEVQSVQWFGYMTYEGVLKSPWL